jgi:hypothetical protein
MVHAGLLSVFLPEALFSAFLVFVIVFVIMGATSKRAPQPGATWGAPCSLSVRR